MQQRGLLAGAIAVLTALGAVQLHLIEWTPPTWLRISSIGLLALAVALWTVLQRLGAPVDDAGLAFIDRNPVRSARLPWTKSAIGVDVTVAEGAAVRRDADVTWKFQVTNRSRRPVTEFQFALSGSARLRAGDLRVASRINDAPWLRDTPLDYRDGFSPVVRVVADAPGLPPGRAMTVTLRYRWPSLSHTRDEYWLLDMRGASVGAPVHLRIRLPHPEYHGELFIVRRLLGARRCTSLGVIPCTGDGVTCGFDVRHVRGRTEELLRLRVSRL